MSTRRSDPELGIIIPCYNEQDVLPELVEQLDELDQSLPFPVFFLFVDDGSLDDTGTFLEDLCTRDSRCACIRFSRNFGHQIAVSAGLEHVRGDIVAVIDADLQDPPSMITEFVKQWKAGYDVVYGIRTNRKEGVLLRAAYAAFYRILKTVAHIDLPLDAGDFSLMDRRVVDEINRMPEHSRFIRGLRGWVGFRQTGVLYHREARQRGDSKYDLGTLTKLALDGLFSFSAVPLQVASWLGALSAFIGFAYLVYAVICRFVGITLPEGWASIVVIVLFMGGIQLMVLGIVGHYLARIFEEVKRRPLYIKRAQSGWLSESTGDT